jgi:probable rRNA maturation factor
LDTIRYPRKANNKNDRFHITVQHAVPKNEMPTVAQLKQWTRKVLQNKKLNVEITIRVVDVAEMTELNKQYRHKIGPTNVLSFPFDMSMSFVNGPPLVGDIVICAAVVNREAEEQGKSKTAHWAHMVIHGTLHLLGYDHETTMDASIMEPLEITILQELGFANPYQ